AADVLADAIDYQQVDVAYRQRGQPAARQSQQFNFAIIEQHGRDRLDQRGLVGRIFHDLQPTQDVAFSEDFAGDGANDLPEAVLHDRPVIHPGAVVFAQADQHHLVQARFDLPDESRMRFDPVGHDYVVRLAGMFVEVD